jgi:hypothetical protein
MKTTYTGVQSADRPRVVQERADASSDRLKARHSSAAGYEAKINQLYDEIGRLTTQVARLKKKSSLEPDPQ